MMISRGNKIKYEEKGDRSGWEIDLVLNIIGLVLLVVVFLLIF